MLNPTFFYNFGFFAGYLKAGVVAVYYWIQGTAELTAAFHSPGGWHRAEKVVVMLDGKLKDHVERLIKEMIDVARYAYNVCVEDTRRLERKQDCA